MEFDRRQDMKGIRDKLINIILKVAMQHHDDISKSDEDAACDAADEILKEFPQIQLPLGPVDKDGDCYYCGKKTNSIAANPSEWCVFLCHKGDSGKVKHHHIGCVIERLNEYEQLKESPILYFVSTERDKEGMNDNHTRCIGYYTTLEDARSNIIGNAETLAEHDYYQYAIIEAFGPGWYPHADIEEWYEFIEHGKKARKIKKPEKYRQICNFAIG